MSRLTLPIAATLLLALFLAPTLHASAQAVAAVPTLDLTRLSGTYYTVARLPVNQQKHCLSAEIVLYALGDKKNTFQIVTSCQISHGNTDYWNASGKLDPAGDGRLNLAWFWPIKTKYWVLAVAPDYGWAVVGTPNRKSLWLLSRTPSPEAGILADLKSRAAAQGFDTAKLVAIPQNDPLHHSLAASTAPEKPAPSTPSPAKQQ
jgi:apolipoprotein D and lipocalin family protein